MMVRNGIIALLLGATAASAQLTDQQIQQTLTEASRYAREHNKAYAEAYAQQAITLAERIYGRADARMVPMLEQVFRLHEEVEDYPKAEGDRLRILALVSRGRNPSDPVIAHERVRLAQFYSGRSQYAQSNGQFEQAMAALSKDAFNKDTELPHVMELYAQSLQLQGREQEAQALLNRAEELRGQRFRR